MSRYIFQKIIGLFSLLAVLPPGYGEVVSKNEASLGFSLYSSLAETEENLVFSPCSLFTSLSMLYVGAREETAAEIEKVLQLSLSRKALIKENAEILHVLKPKEGPNPYVLNIANSLWLDKKASPLSDFRQILQKSFNAKVGLVNFALADKSLSQINDWVSGQTQGKIDKLLTRQDISPSTRLILLNTLYFQGQWVSPFDPEKTQNGDFTTSNKTIQVPMMHQVDKFSYLENKSFQLLVLPFSGETQESGQLACIFLLPKSLDLREVQGMLSFENWNDWLSQAEEKMVDITLPKFSLFQHRLFNDALSSLGMPESFTSEADFSGIDGMHDLYLDKVIQAVDFELDESGLTAAAATSASMKMKSGVVKFPVAFTADHPFLFFVVDLDSNLILFAGHLQNPQESVNEE